MTNLLAPVAKAKFFANNGKPAAGYKLFTYAAGTDTKVDSFPSAGSMVPNPNPITLDYRGECNLWVPPNVAYKFVFAPPNDTDPPTAPIWTVDHIVDSQLVTLWGGVDTGVTNAYVLNFVSNFTQYQDGIVIYWIPSNTNTGPSTINVNGLGPVSITNQDGSPLYLGQLQANQVALIIYKGTGFILIAFGLLPTINVQNGNYTLAITDGNNIVVRDSGALAIDWTIPPNSSVGFPIGTSVEFIDSTGVGDVNIVAGVGVTLIPFIGTDPQNRLSFNAATAYRKIAIDTWQQITPSNSGRITGSFTGTLTGMTGTVTGTISYQKVGGTVTLWKGAGTDLSGTSNTTAMTLTGLPVDLRPKFQVLVPCYGALDNGAVVASNINIATSGVITFVSTFTGSGTKGLRAGWMIIYSII